MMLSHIAVAYCIKIIISPYSNNGKSRYLSHSLKLIPSTLQSSKVFWDLDTDDLKFRIRAGKYYLDTSKENRLLKRDGGKKMEDFDENQKLNELKTLVKGDIREDEETMDMVDAPKKNKNSSIVKKNASKLTSSYTDPISQQYMSEFGMNNSMSFLAETESAFNKAESNVASKDDEKKKSKEEKKTETPSENTKQTNLTEGVDSTMSEDQANQEKNVASNKETKSDKDSKNKSTLVANDMSNNIFGFSSEPTKDQYNDYNDGYTKKSSSSRSTIKNTKGPLIGFNFDLFPIFNHKLEKKMVIMKNKFCLAHDLSFRPCLFQELWNLGPNYYWEVYKAEDTGYLKRLRSVIDGKSNANAKVKENQNAVTKDCPNTCPSGDCESSGSESDDDSLSTSSETTSSNQRYRQTPGTVYQPSYQQPVYNTIPQQQRIYQNPVVRATPQMQQSSKVLVDSQVLNELMALKRRVAASGR